MSSLITSGEKARLLRIAVARRSTAPGISFSSTASILMGTLRSCLRSCKVASMRIWPPNLAYCPQTNVSALLNSASRRKVAGSMEALGATRRSDSTWCSRSWETARKRVDWPTSVLNISARLGPNQSTLGSPEALRKGKIANDSAGPDTVFFGDGEKSGPRNT